MSKKAKYMQIIMPNEITTKRHIEPNIWNSATQKVKGNSEEVKVLLIT